MAADPAAEAQQHFAEAQKLFQAGRFAEAITHYEMAYAAQPYPEFQFNIGQCYRRLGERDKAIAAFERYLSTAPGASNREQVEQLIAELRAGGRRHTTLWIVLAAVATVTVGGVAYFYKRRPVAAPSTEPLPADAPALAYHR